MSTGEKEGILLHLNEYLQEEETGNFLTPSSWEKTGQVPCNRRSQETDAGSQAKRIPLPHLPASPAERRSLRESTGARALEGPRAEGPCGQGGQRGRGDSGGRGQGALPPGPHSPAHGPEPGPAAGVLGRNWVLRDHFRIQPVSRK